ncbi:MAG: nicotinamidase [Armatimonadota bacterium]
MGEPISVRKTDALIVVDLQNDFCPGGALPVPHGDAIVPVVNAILDKFPLVVATQDWHPADHVSFSDRGGPWPPHCVAGTRGAEPHPAFQREKVHLWVRKAVSSERDAYSGFDGTSLGEELKRRGIRRVFVTGLATDYCVRATVLDALSQSFKVVVLTDAVRGVNVAPGDDQRALKEMASAGAVLAETKDLE